MKISKSGLVVLASSGQAFAGLGSWLDWFDHHDGDASVVTATHTRTVEYCPCDGKARIVEPVTDDRGIVVTKTGAFFATKGSHEDPPQPTHDPRTITKGGPVVVVFTTAGRKETKSGMFIELKPTDPADGPVVTKTIWTKAIPTAALEWLHWEDPEDSVTRTRWHTRTVTVTGKAPVGTTDPKDEPWADWIATNKPTSRSTSRSSTRYSSSTSSGGVGPIPGSTSSSSLSSMTTSTSTSSSGSVGPIPGSTSSSSSTTSSGNGVGPIPGSTTSTSSLSTSTSSTSSLSTTSTSSSSNGGVGPIPGSTTSTSSVSTSTSSISTSSTTQLTFSTTTTSPAATTTTAGTGGIQIVDVSALSYQAGILQQHNAHRRNHSAVDLTWDTTLASVAALTAASCVYAHDTVTGGGGYGQNIGAGYQPNQVPGMITNAMYNGEVSNYPGPFDTDNINLANFARFGHFTQIVWKSTTLVGCATQFCPGGLVNFQGGNPYFTVCNYYPPGNIVGAYSNIGAPLGGPVNVVIP